MRHHHPVRPDIHQRFLNVLERAEAKLKQQEEALVRRLTAEIIREKRLRKTSKREERATAPPRPAS